MNKKVGKKKDGQSEEERRAGCLLQLAVGMNDFQSRPILFWFHGHSLGCQ